MVVRDPQYLTLLYVVHCPSTHTHTHMSWSGNQDENRFSTSVSNVVCDEHTHASVTAAIASGYMKKIRIILVKLRKCTRGDTMEMR